MVDRLLHPGGNTVLLFGPQALSFDKDAFQALRTALLTTKDHQWILDTITGFTQCLDLISRDFPELIGTTRKQLQDLNDWLKTGDISANDGVLPNTLLTPLVIITQLVQYARYLEVSHPDAANRGEDLYASSKSNTETLGFCTGLLSALAVSSSNSKEKFQKYGAVALRLGLLIGMVVDAQEISSEVGPSKSLAVVWQSDEAGEEVTQILKKFPEAYVSVSYDKYRATVTTSTKDAAALQHQLRAVGIIATEVGLRGRFHWDGHRSLLKSLTDFCTSHEDFNFPDASALTMPTRSNSHGDFLSQGPLHQEALRSILTEQSQWHKTFLTVQESSLKDKRALVVSFGPERCVPPSLIRRISSQVIQMSDVESELLQAEPQYTDNDIAVVGMSCKVAGADNLEEFWQLLCEGKSQHQEVPKERFGFETPFRDADPKRKWFGNFMNDFDKFDHKFFKKSPREVASMDPQQRHILQIAYQAVEQSGWFHKPNADRRVGCYVGVCAVDYENNIACHAPNAFSATGNLKGFIAGKVSHYFGWTGPGLTIDTACSSSAVAVHQACQAIRSGECSAALAGGTHVMTNPLWYQNLAGASFLSLTGSCKPFDIKADGYCRGEGVAAVFLKKMSLAIADGDQILGTIAGTAVQQNQNCTPIFVPNAPSLSDLFRVVTRQARLKPDQITAVEAHGTGTAVGDPAEYESIRQVLGGANRLKPEPLMLSSVKGLVGHVECTSGLISLIKVLLMIRMAAIPPQASFDTINPAIGATPADKMRIPTSLMPWTADFRAALINNYGASGSNASIVVTQFSGNNSRKTITQYGSTATPSIKYPFWITGLDDKSLRSYATALRRYLGRNSEPASTLSLPNIAFNVFRQSNRVLDRGLMFSCSSFQDLDERLADFENGTLSSVARPAPRPLIMCFGGQNSTYVGLDRHIYETVQVFRKHLDACNAACLAHGNGAGSIFPGIFQRSPVGSAVELQTMLFAFQYSCAKTWIDCGARPVALLGHSFGELTALCVSGVLTLQDTFNMIIGRANIIRTKWGADQGAMMAVEADLADVEQLITQYNQSCPNLSPASIACFNGPRSFTLAGSTEAIDAVSTHAKDFSSSMRTKRLNVTNAFHSALVDPLMPELERVALELNFGEAQIPIARATYHVSDGQNFNSKFVAEHMRQPVYFHQAACRLAEEFPSAIWLEAGSNSTVTAMADRALGRQSTSHFQAINIISDNSMSGLSEATLSLWKAGLNISFWPHHDSQTYSYSSLLLPPYQFEKVRHWIDLKSVTKAVVEVPVQVEDEKLPDSLLTFVGYQDKLNRCARFRVNTMIPKYQRIISGHKIAQTAPICPATIQIDLAIEGLRSLRPDMGSSRLQPEIHGVDNQSPICIDPSRSVWLELEAMDVENQSWAFRLISTRSKGSSTAIHTTGKIIIRSIDDAQVQRDFAKYERLIGHHRCVELLKSVDADDIIQGRNIYKTFAEIVDYGEDYQGLQRLVGKGNESAGYVVKRYNSETWLDAHLSDAFCQVGGIWVNCMTDRATSDMYIANGIEQWVRSPNLDSSRLSEDARPDSWHVFASHHGPFEKAYLTDVFIFNACTGKLTEVILGINYVKVSKAAMSKMLSRLSAGNSDSSQSTAAMTAKIESILPSATFNSLQKATAKISKIKKEKKKPTMGSDISGKVKAILADLSGLELHEIGDDSELANLGIDSLMGMEMSREIENEFKCTLDPDVLIQITDMPGLMKCVYAALPAGSMPQEETPDESSDEDDRESSKVTSVFTPSDSDTNLSSVGETNVTEYLAEFLGIEKSDMAPDLLLRDLGVDSLLSTELRADFSSKFDFEISEHVAIEELTVGQLDSMVNGTRTPAGKEKPKQHHSVSAESNPSPASAKISPSSSTTGDLKLPPSKVLEAFRETKALTDQVIADHGCSDYVKAVLPVQNEMCIVLTLETFELLGCTIRTAKPGEEVSRIKYLPEYEQLVEYLYGMLEKEGRLIEVKSGRMARTAVPLPSKSSKDLVKELNGRFPGERGCNDLTYYAGVNLAKVLKGETDGIKLIFGSEEGRKLVSGLYGDWPLNKVFYKQMQQFLTRLVSKLSMHEGPLKILEMGAGTGGTTKWLVPLLDSLNVPVEYTFTDLAPSFVASARKLFKQYKFMKFRTHDIEKEPAEDLLKTQHIIIASNAVHATHSLTKSGANIRKALRDDGLLIMLEMTGTLYWCDMIFGLFEGWWLFEDGRVHAVTNETRWERELQSVGYGHVDWTDGARPENKLEKFFIAMASGSRYERLPIPPKPEASPSTDCASRKAVIDDYIRKITQGFICPVPTTAFIPEPQYQTVLLTGATGSVGSHLVAHLAELPHIKTIICLNRRSNQDPRSRQIQALITKGIFVPAEGLAKLKVFETDASKPMLGLSNDVYNYMLETVTHVIHNAWLMSAKRPVKGFESQFHIMRNMIDLVSIASSKRPRGSKITFEFVSSIAVVGHYPLWSKNINVPEERMTIESVLPNGYGDAKYACELMLDETLLKHPDRFRTFSVRIGQIAGSKSSGYWNPMEHLSYLWKSSQTLKALPDFQGLLSWTPVDDVAATLSDLLQVDNPYPIYHIDNPVRQQWREMIPVLAEALGVPDANRIPFPNWVELVRNSAGLVEADNPAVKLIDFLDANFLRMSCGGLLLDTTKSREHSATLRSVGPVSEDVARKFVQSWKAVRFLS